ncbi:MAG: transcriptional regulator [Propionibacterium sp.]|nr:transcriptional regulator [Propionibacterium sp.]
MAKLSKGKRVRGELRREVQQSFVERYQAGESIRSLAADSGRSYGFVQALLKDAGVTFRPRGGALGAKEKTT